MEIVKLIAGKLNRGTETLYWKIDSLTKIIIGDYAIVENAQGYDLVKIAGVVVTEKEKASYFSKSKYENMKSVIKIINSYDIEEKVEDTNDKHIPRID